ncbi:hypothetical protein [Paramicrobacterium agarici]|uniref:BMP family ABC transporter substrate-binding protein n=1 Tax=Paramicrobacterium agarici TaxID=630514 RepID=A0A2A9DVM3_9MICO|nr:hypothetical protein [Microbacterium agarici]PFG30042.1 hypothetical protein ATJ78_0962 [Microbacterium agarici]
MSPLTRIGAAALVLAAALTATACTTTGQASDHAATSQVPGASGSSEPSAEPSPGSTMPVPENLPAVAPGLDIALVVSASPGTEIPDAVTAAATEIDATVDVISSEPSNVIDGLVAAAEGADVVLMTGADLLVSVDAVSSQMLDTQFLIIGAQLPEPTGNVTAVVWRGANARTAGAAASADLVDRLPAALRAGLAMIGDGSAGMVYELPE